jgi:hypothetical protein
MILISFKKESFFKHFNGSQSIMLTLFYQGSFYGEYIFLYMWSPFVYCLVNEKIISIKLGILFHFFPGVFWEIKITNHLRIFRIYSFVSHFPYRRWTTFKKFLNSINLVLEIKLGSSIISWFNLKYSLFNSFICKFLLEFTIEKRFNSALICYAWIKIFFKRNFINSIWHAI